MLSTPPPITPEGILRRFGRRAIAHAVIATTLNLAALGLLAHGLFGPVGQTDHPPELQPFVLYGAVPIALLLLASRVVKSLVFRCLIVAQAALATLFLLILW